MLAINQAEGCLNVEDGLNTAINTLDDTVEILILGRYWVRDSRDYSVALYDSAKNVISYTRQLFTEDEDGNIVKWNQGISVNDIIQVKDRLVRFLYEIYR